MSLSNSDSRLTELLNWLQNDLELPVTNVLKAASDASFRRYFRIFNANGSYIAMDAPPGLENTASFIRIATLFKSAQLRTPEIFARNEAHGFLLLEDFGDINLLDSVTQCKENADNLYSKAIDSMLHLQTDLPIRDSALPIYDTALLTRELDIFCDWFLEKLLQVNMPLQLKDLLYTCLIDSALAQPQVCVHRDYHSRNLMLPDDAALGIIDFQDAVIGPITYDSASLLRDCYIVWPDDWVMRQLNLIYRLSFEKQLVTVDFTQFKRWFDLMGLQRHLKAIGIFSRLNLRDNKSQYLADIPRTMGYVSHVSHQYAELQEFSAFLTRQILPIYRSYL